MEFVQFTQQPKVSTRHIVDLFQMICTNIFRPVPPFPCIFVRASEDPVASDDGWIHTKLCYRILLKITPDVPTYDRFFFERVVARLHTPQKLEQDQITSFLSIAITTFPYTRKSIKKAILIALVDYLDLNQYAFSIGPCLYLLYKHYNTLKMTSKEYIESCIPVIKGPHTPYFGPSFSKLTEKVLEEDPASGSVIFERILSLWPQWSSTKQLFFIRLLVSAAEKLAPDTKKAMAPRLAGLLGRTCQCADERVAEEAIQAWSSLDIPPMADAMEALAAVSSGHWSSSVKNAAIGALKGLHDRDPRALQGAARALMFPRDSNEGEHTTWTLVAQRAAEHDMALDLLAILERVNGAFPPSRPVRKPELLRLCAYLE